MQIGARGLAAMEMGCGWRRAEAAELLVGVWQQRKRRVVGLWKEHSRKQRFEGRKMLGCRPRGIFGCIPRGMQKCEE